MTTSYLVQRAVGGRTLMRDAPLVRRSQGPEWKLSAVGTAEWEISPDLGEMTAIDGNPLFWEWGTTVYEIVDGTVRWGGIVVSSKASGNSWTIEASNLSTYAYGMPFMDAYYGTHVDPAALVGMVWDHLQSFPDGDLGVRVVGTTNVQLGSASHDEAEEIAAAYNAAAYSYSNAASALAAAQKALATARSNSTSAVAVRTTRTTALAAAYRSGDATAVATAQDALDAATTAAATAAAAVTAAAQTVSDQTGTTGDLKQSADELKAARDAANATKATDGGAWSLLWWEQPDCGRTIDTLASDTPFDWVETWKLGPDGDTVATTIEVHYPRLGSRKTQLRFVLGENIIEQPEIATDGDEYANGVAGVGAGEGVTSRRRATAVRDGRLRRIASISDKTATSNAALDSRINRELVTRRATVTIASITVINHPNASFGSFAVGDDILVDVTVPFYGHQQIWHRITGMSETNDITAQLELARSDSFTYGG